MKRLQLKVKDLTNPTILGYHEIKNIMGGSDYVGDGSGSGGSGGSGSGTCIAWTNINGNGFGGICEDGLTRAQAEAKAYWYATNYTNGHYCCDSCAEHSITYV